MIAITKFKYQVNLFPQREIDFSEGMNLLHSEQNAQGKTAIIRMLLFAMGYPVPDSKGFKLDDMQFELTVKNGRKIITIIKKNSDQGNSDLNIYIDNKSVFAGTFRISRLEIQKAIFGDLESNLLDNLLGTFYIDQEKGWTMLNRGKVIGSIKFSIECFLCAIGDKRIDELKNEISRINAHVQEYRKLLSVASIVEDSRLLRGEVVTESRKEMSYKEVRELSVEISSIKKELSTLKNIKLQNSRFRRYIEHFSLTVKSKTGEIVPVNAKTLVGFEQNSFYIQARIEILTNSLQSFETQRSKLLEAIHKEDEIYKNDELLINYRNRIQNAELNSFMIQEAIDSLNSRKSSLQAQIRNLSKNSWLYRLNSLIRGYMERLEVKWPFEPGEDIATTNKLAQFSGSEMTKRVLSFRFAYLKILDERFKLKLPIVIDSPYAKEFDRDNFHKMLNILRDDFKSHQIIIASIYDYGFNDNYMRISINGGAWEEVPTFKLVPKIARGHGPE